MRFFVDKMTFLDFENTHGYFVSLELTHFMKTGARRWPLGCVFMCFEFELKNAFWWKCRPTIEIWNCAFFFRWNRTFLNYCGLFFILKSQWNYESLYIYAHTKCSFAIHISNSKKQNCRSPFSLIKRLFVVCVCVYMYTKSGDAFFEGHVTGNSHEGTHAANDIFLYISMSICRIAETHFPRKNIPIDGNACFTKSQRRAFIEKNDFVR